MTKTELQAMADDIRFIVECNLPKLDPEQKYTLKEMAGEEAWELTKGHERTIGTRFREYVNQGNIGVVYAGETSNSNLYQLI